MADIDQDEPLNPKALTDPNSSFYKINSVRLHHKVCSHEDEDSSSDQSTGSTSVPLLPQTQTLSGKARLACPYC
jgi:hypothetical protein|uniref:Uncharacterized protein n=1 Tax=Zea mays TaxID=4577 RepID=A0A804PHR6_MAIZE